MDKKKRQLINKYIELFYRRKVLIISLFLLSLPIGLGTYLLSPDVATSIPEKQIEPNFLVIIGMTVIGGISAGLAITLVFDFFDTSFRDPHKIEQSLGVELLTTIPLFETPEEERKKRKKTVMVSMLLSFISLLIVTMFVCIWLRGYIVI
ncbi:MAG: heme/copper-type cytochrome/quinol oxidase subunit 2 [Desulforhopalus sp.]|jgi:heme/copper-type cytochrome/quinol oxidase subunit 2